MCLFRDRKTLELYIGLFMIPFVFGVWYFTLESWKWLISVGRLDDAKMIAIKIYKKQNNFSEKDVQTIGQCIESIYIQSIIGKDVSDKKLIQEYSKGLYYS